MKTLKEALNACTLDGLNIKPPSAQLDRKLYLELKQALELIGGKWKGGKTFAFVFEKDPTELFRQICNGEKKNLKKEYQFFATPDELADKLVSLVDWDAYGDSPIIIGEPSAGQGAIIKAIRRANVLTDTRGDHIFACELMDTNIAILDRECSNITILNEHDFMKLELDNKFHVIVANPPFTKNQDIDHLRKMYDHLIPDGQLVCMTSKHWENSGNRKESQFREWLMDLDDCEVIDVDANAFKSSGTSIETNIIVIRK